MRNLIIINMSRLQARLYSKEDRIGTMIPCKVNLQEQEDNEIEVAAVDSDTDMMAFENRELAVISVDIRKNSNALSYLYRNAVAFRAFFNQ